VTRLTLLLERRISAVAGVLVALVGCWLEPCMRTRSTTTSRCRCGDSRYQACRLPSCRRARGETEGIRFADLELESRHADTVFEIGSITKQFVAAALMTLVEEARSTWTSPLQVSVRSTARLARGDGPAIATHTSGIPDSRKSWATAHTALYHRTAADCRDSCETDGLPPGASALQQHGYYLLA